MKRRALVCFATLPWMGLSAISPTPVDWTKLRSPRAQSLDGVMIRILGFMVPLDDDSRRVTEFLLVPTLGACVHTPSPPANQIVLVTMATGAKAEVVWDRPIWVTGRFKIGVAAGVLGARYKLEGQRIEIVQDY